MVVKIRTFEVSELTIKLVSEIQQKKDLRCVEEKCENILCYISVVIVSGKIA